MYNYIIDTNQKITEQIILDVLRDYQSRILPVFKKRENYYNGKHKIVFKQASDESKPCNKIVTNYVKNIIETYTGYCTGKPVSYQSDNDSFEEIMNIMRYNDVDEEDTKLFKQALIYGRASEICYFDEQGKVRFKLDDVKRCIPIYDNTLDRNLVAVIRFYEEQLTPFATATYKVEVFDSYCKTVYNSAPGWASLTFVNKDFHNFKQVPFSIMQLNDEEEGVADCVFTLNDAYNSLMSDSLDDWDSFCDSYLVLYGMNADEEDLTAMKKHRLLMMDTDCKAEYLVKATNQTEIENLLKTTEEKIREISQCPNMANETFATSSGIAIRYRLLGMEEKASEMINRFKVALQRRIELICDVINMVNGTEAVWRDINISFSRNIPNDLSDLATSLNSFRGLVSDKSLLTQIPFITDVDKEIEQINRENKTKQDLYSFEEIIDEE